MSLQYPKTGNLVWYYAGGVGAPIAALVTASNGSILCLTLFRKNAKAVELKSGILERSDPRHKERPERLRNNGCWTYIDNEIPEVRGHRKFDLPMRDEVNEICRGMIAEFGGSKAFAEKWLEEYRKRIAPKSDAKTETRDNVDRNPGQKSKSEPNQKK